jgi:hypothetical protein
VVNSSHGTLPRYEKRTQMAEPSEVQSVSPQMTATVHPRLSIWQRLRGFGLKKLLLVCVGIGAGLAIGIVATVASVVWLTSRPIAARDWPRLEVKGAGLKAKLRTDWNDSVRYQLIVEPRSNDLEPAFDDTVRSHRDSISFTVLLYDEAGFELCKKDISPTPLVGTEGRVDGLQANGAFYSFECSRSNYKGADHWNLSYVFPALVAATAAAHSENKTTAGNNSRQAGTPQGDASGDEEDTLTGFDLLSGHLETLSGNTFVVREAEKSVASMWNINAQLEGVVGGRQPRLHITCKVKSECVIENTANSQAVHGKRIR